MDPIVKFSQDLEFLTKLFRSSDFNSRLKLFEGYETYPSSDEQCIPQEIFFNSNFNLESIDNLEQVLNTLQRCVKDNILVNKLNEQIQSIITMNDKQIEENADHLVFMSCCIFINKLSYKTNIKYLSRVEELISNKKVEHIKNLKQKFLFQIGKLSSTNQINLEYKKYISPETIDAYTHITHTHRVLEINSPNVVWSGSSAYHLGWAETNSNELVDIDLFIIGTPEEKKVMVDKIISNLTEVFGFSNIIFKICGSVGYVFIKGIPRIIQLICWGNSSTTHLDVITHFDFDYLKSIIKYDEKSNSYICYSMDCAVRSNESKEATTSMNSKKIKPYRFVKAKSNNFDISSFGPIDFGANDYYVISKNILAKEYYTSTSNLTTDIANLDFDLDNLFGVKSNQELILNGSFDTYCINPKLAPRIKSLSCKLTQSVDIFDEQKIVLRAKILSLNKYDFGAGNHLIILIDNPETINLINQFATNSNNLINSVACKQVKTSCIVKNGTGFTKENLTKELDKYYKKILEGINPNSMIIKVKDTISYNFEVGQTYIIRGVLRGYVSANHAGVSIKLV